MSGKAAVRITTMCLGRICVGYRAASSNTSGPDYIDVVSVFVSAFVVVWAVLVVLLVVRAFSYRSKRSFSSFRSKARALTNSLPFLMVPYSLVRSSGRRRRYR
jgi:hypothetical protein